MDYGQSELEILRVVVGGKQHFLKAALEQHEEGWTMRYLEAVAGGRPAGWRHAVWEYEGLIFIADEVPGQAIASALTDAGDGSLTLSGYEAVVPPVRQQISFQHYPSRAARPDEAPLRWPAIAYDVHRHGEAPPQGRSGLLVGEGCPSFPAFETAFRAFFFGNFSSIGAGPLPTELGRIRVVQAEAWLDRVRVMPTHLDIRVAGEAVDGTRVEISGSTWHATRRVGTTGRVRLRLPSGLPEDAWLYLSRERRWLDYRRLGPRLSGLEELARSGVEVEVPKDPQSEIEALLSSGEGPYVEYKLKLPGNKAEEKRKVLKTVAAFANLGGGSIVFGIDPDETTVAGLGEVSPQDVRDRLGNLIRGNVVPPDPVFDVRWASVNGRLVVVLDVEQSEGRPYGVRFQDKPVEFYVRRGASSYPATQEEIRSLAKADNVRMTERSAWGLHHG